MITDAVILANAEIRDEIIISGADMLRRGASAADVAEQIARDVEDDPDEHSVGYGGLPNILGEVELDASFMDGATLKVGAVAALKGFCHPISVARQVMERLPHVLLIGEGAARFADEIGAERRNMLSPEARQMWLEQLQKLNVYETIFHPSNSLTDLKAQMTGRVPDLIGLVNRAMKRHEGSDTMNVIVRDMNGHLVTAVTTSGIAWKYPGRVGDSPMIGAGNYCDDRFGAAACMGLGEITMRLNSAAHAIMLMRAGKSLQTAGTEVVRDMLPLLGAGAVENHMERADWVRLLLVDHRGNVGGFATQPGLSFKVQTPDEDKPRELSCEFVS
jgi:beta-aspartyl-peptidase (threonine type)